VKVVTLSFQTLFSKSYNQLKEKLLYMYCALYTESAANALTWMTWYIHAIWQGAKKNNKKMDMFGGKMKEKTLIVIKPFHVQNNSKMK